MNTTPMRRLLARPAARPIHIPATSVRYLSHTRAQLADNAKKPQGGRGNIKMGPGSIQIPEHFFSRPRTATREAETSSSAPRTPPTGNSSTTKKAYSSAISNLNAILGPGFGRSKISQDREAELEALTASLRDRHLQARQSAVKVDGMVVLEPPYHFHVYAHKHNTHVTVTKPDASAIVSLSCGNLGFRKARRKSYDAAYQLTVAVLNKLYDAGWHSKITKMEVVLRGFGAGREAATKVLLGNEGAMLRDKIVRVSDSTRIKFGGTRSRNPRRV